MTLFCAELEHEILLKRIEEFRKLNMVAKMQLINFMQTKLNYKSWDHSITDIAYMNENRQGYMTHYTDFDGETKLIELTYKWKWSENFIPEWNEKFPIIIIK